MSEAELKAIGAIEIALSIAMCVLLVSGLIPGTYGLYQWLGDHTGLAPWFSGGATTLGVLVALWNTDRQVKIALAKEQRDEERAAENASRIAKGYANASGGVLARAFSVANQLHNALMEDPEDLRIDCESNSFRILQMKAVARALQKFPVHLIESGTAIETWYKVELFIDTIVSELQAAKQIIASDESSIERCAKSIINDCDRVMRNVNSYREAVDLRQFKRQQNAPAGPGPERPL